MKLFKKIMALCVLMSAPSAMFGGSPERTTVAKKNIGTPQQIAAQKAVLAKIVQTYIEKSPEERTERDAIRARAASNSLNNLGKFIPLTAQEKDMIGQVNELLPYQGQQVSQDQMDEELGSGKLPVSGKKQVNKARTVKRTPRRQTTASVRRNARNTTNRTRAQVKRPLVGKKTIANKGSVSGENKIALEKFNQSLQFFFGEGTLKDFFIGSRIRTEKLMTAFNRLESLRQQTSLSREDVSKLIYETVISNGDSTLSTEQRNMLISEMDKLLKSSNTGYESQTQGSTDPDSALVEATNGLLNRNLRSFFYSNGELNTEAVSQAIDSIMSLKYQSSLTNQQLSEAIAEIVMNNPNSGITDSQKDMLITQLVNFLPAQPKKPLTATTAMTRSIEELLGGNLSAFYNNGVLNQKAVELATAQLRNTVPANLRSGLVGMVISRNKNSGLTQKQLMKLKNALEESSLGYVSEGQRWRELVMPEMTVTSEENVINFINKWFSHDLRVFFDSKTNQLNTSKLTAVFNQIMARKLQSELTNGELERALEEIIKNNLNSFITEEQKEELINFLVDQMRGQMIAESSLTKPLLNQPQQQWEEEESPSQGLTKTVRPFSFREQLKAISWPSSQELVKSENLSEVPTQLEQSEQPVMEQTAAMDRLLEGYIKQLSKLNLMNFFASQTLSNQEFQEWVSSIREIQEKTNWSNERTLALIQKNIENNQDSNISAEDKATLLGWMTQAFNEFGENPTVLTYSVKS